MAKLTKIRRRYQRHTKAITGKTTVYSASAWWPDNDPSEQVIATSASEASRLIHLLMKDAEQREIEDRYDYGDDDPHSVRSAPAMHWSGVHAFALGKLVSGRHLKDAIRDYPKTP